MSEVMTVEREGTALGIDAEQLRIWMTSGATLTLLDVRSRAAFDADHLPGAIHSPVNNGRELVEKIRTDGMTIILCEDGAMSRQVAGVLEYCGLDRVGFLDGGMAAWRGLPGRSTVPSITPQELRYRIEEGAAGPLLVDVRPEAEFRAARMAGSIHAASAQEVAAKAANREVVLVSCTGRRALEAHAALLKVGVRSVVLEGGLDAWVASGGRVERGGGLIGKVLWVLAGVAGMAVIALATR